MRDSTSSGHNPLHKELIVPALLLLMALLASSSPAAAQTYQLTDLGTLGGATSVARAINDANQVVGYSEVAAGATHPFLWNAGALVDLGSLGTNGYAYGINNLGHIVGYSSTPNPLWPACGRSGIFCLESFDQATLWSAGSITGLGTLGGPNSYAYGVNDAGQVVGIADVPDNGNGPIGDAFLYNAGSMTDLGAQGGTTLLGCSAFAINDVGTVAGACPDANGIAVPALWTGGTLGYPGTFQQGVGKAVALDSSAPAYRYVAGDNAVYIYSNGSLVPHATLWTNGVPIDLGTLGGFESHALGTNDAGQVVGSANLAGDTVIHAALWAPLWTGLPNAGQVVDLNALLDPTVADRAHIVLSEARAINNNGWIIANGTNSVSGQAHAYLLSPEQLDIVVAPASLSFGNQAVGTSAPAQSITVSNTGLIPFGFEAVQLTPDYSQTNDCGVALAAGAHCTFQVHFAPTMLGNLSTQLTIASGGTRYPVALAGVGTLAATLDASINSVTVGQPVTLTWSSAAGATCTATGGSAGDGWAGDLAASGSSSVMETAAGPYTYIITCNGAGQVAAAQVAVTVNAPPGTGGGGRVDALSLLLLAALVAMRAFAVALDPPTSQEP